MKVWTRVCTRCRQAKSVDEFPRKKSGDGRSYRCRPCNREEWREYSARRRTNGAAQAA